MEFTINELNSRVAARLHESYKAMGWQKPEGYFEECLEKQNRGDIVFLFADDSEGNYLGHCKVVWNPDYPFFREKRIPETQDLNVLPAYRRRGIATALAHRSEEIIKKRSGVAGIGVGLHPGYNAAQVMYVNLGYIPDGQGVVYRDKYVKEGQSVIMDDDLVLHFIKRLA